MHRPALAIPAQQAQRLVLAPGSSKGVQVVATLNQSAAAAALKTGGNRRVMAQELHSLN